MHCLIVDDDLLICDLLQHFCSKVDFITDVTVTNSGFESINLISKGRFDLVLLDYNLPDITGKEILKLINPDTAVIMVTSHMEFAPESYDYDNIVDFLVKPIEFARFYKGVQKARHHGNLDEIEKNLLFVKDGNQLIKVDLEAVLFIKSAANYVEIVFENKKVMTLITLKDMEQKLPRYFQRVHRSYIVNVHKIESITTGTLKLNRHEISISASYQPELMEKINLLS